MIREERFLLSRRPYAVDLSSMRHGESWPEADAVWYRRRRGVTVACIGRLWLFDARGMSIEDPVAVLEAAKDGRYGGDCRGRWDGENYWGAQRPEVMAEHLELLRPMLEGYPVIPASFDGWWTFQPPRKGE